MEKLNQAWNNFLNWLADKGLIVAVIIGLLPASLILYGGYVFLIEPGSQANEEQKTIVKKKEEEMARGQAVEKNEKEFRQQFTRVVELFNDTLPLLPKETELSSVLMDVQEAARRYPSLTLTGLIAVKDAVQTANANKFYEREMPCTVVGNYDDVMRFFLDISRMQRILIIRDFAVTSAKNKQTSARPSFVSVQFSLLAFHAPASPPAELRMPPGIIPNPPARAALTGLDVRR